MSNTCHKCPLLEDFISVFSEQISQKKMMNSKKDRLLAVSYHMQTVGYSVAVSGGQFLESRLSGSATSRSHKLCVYLSLTLLSVPESRGLPRGKRIPKHKNFLQLTYHISASLLHSAFLSLLLHAHECSHARARCTQWPRRSQRRPHTVAMARWTLSLQ